MKRIPTALSLALLLLVALGGNLAFSPGSAGAEEDVAIKLSEGVEIEMFLKAVSTATGTPFVWDPADKQIRGKRMVGAIDLKAPRGELFDRVRALLTFYELVLIPVGPTDKPTILVMDARRTTSILKLKARNITLTDDNLSTYEGKDGLYVTTTIKVEHMKEMRNARNALTRIVTGQNIGNVTEVPDARSFVITDFAPNVVAIYRLIKQMDKPAPEEKPDTAFQSVNLSNANAGESAAVLSRLFNTSRAAARGQPPVRQGPSIQADARTNSILVSGKSAEVEQVMQAISVLDQEAPEPEVNAHMLRLSHMPAREAANALVQLIGGARTLWRNQGDERTRPSVVALDRVNGLLVSASNTAFEKIRRMVAEMDEAAREAAEKDEGGGDK